MRPSLTRVAFLIKQFVHGGSGSFADNRGHNIQSANHFLCSKA